MQNRIIEGAEPRKLAFATKIEDIIGGVALDTSSYSEGDFIPSGSIIGKGSNGLYKVLKTGKLFASASNSDTKYKLHKDHNLKVGEYMASAVQAKAYAIVSIDTSDAEFDEIELSASLGVSLNTGATVFQASGESTNNTSAFAVTPYAVTDGDVWVSKGGNHFVAAYLRATLYEDNVPPVTTAMKNALGNNILWV